MSGEGTCPVSPRRKGGPVLDAVACRLVRAKLLTRLAGVYRRLPSRGLYQERQNPAGPLLAP